MASGIRFHNLDITISKIRSIGEGAPAYLNDLAKRTMVEDIWPVWLRHISLTDHSLQDLASLDHPYSNRYAMDSFAHPDEDVHIQSGDLVNASTIEYTDTGTGTVARLLNRSIEYVYLRYGTSLMRMRDPAGATMRDAFPAIKKRFHEGVKNAIVNLTRS